MNKTLRTFDMSSLCDDAAILLIGKRVTGNILIV